VDGAVAGDALAQVGGAAAFASSSLWYSAAEMAPLSAMASTEEAPGAATISFFGGQGRTRRPCLCAQSADA
jgi:hypothetical protein